MQVKNLKKNIPRLRRGIFIKWSGTVCRQPKAVRTGKQFPCLSGKIQGSSGVLAGFLILASKISIWINLCFYINSLTSKTENEQGTQLKHFYQILFMRVAL